VKKTGIDHKRNVEHGQRFYSCIVGIPEKEKRENRKEAIIEESASTLPI